MAKTDDVLSLDSALTIDDILSKARLPERSVPLCLRGDLQADFEELERRLADVKERDETVGSAGKLATPNGSGEARELAQRIQDLRQQMRDATVSFRFRGQPRTEYSDLLAAHRKEKGDADNLLEGYEWEKLGPAIVSATCIAPKMSVEQAGVLADKLTDRQWDMLCGAAITVNKSDVEVPFSVAASATLLSTAEK